MENGQTFGVLLILIGLIFIIFPIFSLSLVSIFIGIGLFLSSLGLLISGLSLSRETSSLGLVNIIIGIIGAILGIVFMFNVGAYSTIVALEFFIVGFILIFLAITGYFGSLRIINGTGAIVTGVFGIIIILLGLVARNPVYLSAMIGILLLLYGVKYFLDGETLPSI